MKSTLMRHIFIKIIHFFIKDENGEISYQEHGIIPERKGTLAPFMQSRLRYIIITFQKNTMGGNFTINPGI